MTDLERDVFDKMVDELEGLQGGHIDLTDSNEVAYKAFECANGTGSYFCNTYASREWLLEHSFDISEISDSGYYDDMIDFGGFFSNPEALMVQILIVVGEELASQINFENDFVEFLEDKGIDTDEVDLSYYEIDDNLLEFLDNKREEL